MFPIQCNAVKVEDGGQGTLNHELCTKNHNHDDVQSKYQNNAWLL